MTVTPTPSAGSGQLELLKALGDNTRFAIYEHLAAAGQPLTTAEIAELLGLHSNTVRPHLERMREVGLIDVSVDGRGEVGRPHHRYAIAAVAPSLGFEPSGVAELADLALAMARRLGASSDDAYEIGYERGARRADHYGSAPSTLEALVADLGRLGFDPTVEEADDHETAIVSFGRCPFQAQVEEHPDLICTLHHGIVSGLVREMGDARVIEFCDRGHRTPCRVAVGER